MNKTRPPEKMGEACIMWGILICGIISCGCSGPLPQENPSVIILTPPFDSGVMAGNVTVVAQVSGFTLVPPGKDTLPGSGHLIFYRDTVPPVTAGRPAVTSPGSFGITSSPEWSWTNVTPGTHTFAVQLVNSDNTPLSVPVVDAADVTVVSRSMIASSGGQP